VVDAGRWEKLYMRKLAQRPGMAATVLGKNKGEHHEIKIYFAILGIAFWDFS